MKVLTKEDLLILIRYNPKESYDENEIVELFSRYGDDYFIEGNQFKRFRGNERMIKLRNTLKEMENYLP